MLRQWNSVQLAVSSSLYKAQSEAKDRDMVFARAEKRAFTQKLCMGYGIERPHVLGLRTWLTDKAFAARLTAAKRRKTSSEDCKRLATRYPPGRQSLQPVVGC